MELIFLLKLIWRVVITRFRFLKLTSQRRLDWTWPLWVRGHPIRTHRSSRNFQQNYIGKCVFIFLDDILVFSCTYEQHLLDVEKVFLILEANQFYVNAKKSEFGLQEIAYLGFIISSDGIRLDLEKIQAIQEWEISQTAHHMRSFVGLCQAYNRHMEIICGPLPSLK